MSSKSRKNARAVVQLVARYRSPTVFNFVEEECYDLSTGGMFIKSPAPAPAGTLLKLECDGDDGEQQIKAVARVVWARLEEDQDGPVGMGVKFIKLEPGGKELIESLIAGRASLIPGGERYRGSSVPPAQRDSMDSEALTVGPISDVAPAPDAPEPTDSTEASPPAPVSEAPEGPRDDAHTATEAVPDTSADGAQEEASANQPVSEAPEREAVAQEQAEEEPAESEQPEASAAASDPGEEAPAGDAPVSHEDGGDGRGTSAVEAPPPPQAGKSNSGLWVALVAALVLGGAIWFQSMNSGEAPQAPAAAPSAPAAPPENGAADEAPPAEAAEEPETAEEPEASKEPEAAEPAAQPPEQPAPEAEAPAADEPSSEPEPEAEAEAEATGATRYVVHVITRPGGARVTYRDKHVYAPGDIELEEPPGDARIRAEKAGYHATAANIDASDFEPSEDTPGLMIRRIYLVLKKE